MRTWWHPLLVSLLRWQLGSHYHVQDEVPVGSKPLQIDILLVDKEQGELPPRAREMLAGLVERLGESTLVEFKGPSDNLQAGDLQTFLAYTLLYRVQRDPLLEPGKLHLIVIAPRLTKPYRDELKVLGVTANAEELGVWRLQGGMAEHPMWLLETEVLAGVLHPLLTVVSPKVRRDASEVYDALTRVGYNELISYMCQQISQFRASGKEFAMQHVGAEAEMHKTLGELLRKLPLEDRLDFASHDPVLVNELLKGLPAEERVKGLPAEERVKGLPMEERLKGLSAEECLRALTPQERERMRKLLQEREEKANGE